MVGCPLRPVRRGRGVTTRWNGSVPPLDAAAAGGVDEPPVFFGKREGQRGYGTGHPGGLCLQSGGHGEDHGASGRVHQVVLIFQSVGHSDGISLEKVLGKAVVWGKIIRNLFGEIHGPTP